MTQPRQLTPLTDDDNVEFHVVEEDEGDQPGTGLNDEQLLDFLHTAPADAQTLTASGDTETLYASDHSGEVEAFEVTAADAPVQRVGTTNPRSITWEGVLALEGEETGDGREFAHGSLDWAVPPLPLMYQYETSHGGDTDKSTNVGNITEVWRDGSKIMGRGTIDLDDPYGMQAARKMKNKYLNGVSIDADSVKNADIELIFAQPDPSATEEEQLIEMMSGAPPEKTIFHRGRVRGATLVNLPAFVGASLELTGDLSMLDEGVITAAGNRKYVRDTEGRFAETPDSDAAKGLLNLREHTHSSVWSEAQKMSDGDVISSTKNTRLVAKKKPSGNGMMITEEGFFNDEWKEQEDFESLDDFREIADLQNYTDQDLEQSDEEFEDRYGPTTKKKHLPGTPGSGYDVKVITAAAAGGKRGYTIEIPDVPPLAFFEEPKELPPIGAVWIEPNGHIFGLVGPSGVPHRAFRNKRVTIPMGNVDYTRWMNRPTVVENYDGELIKIRTGVITMNCGHLSPYATDDSAERMKHYDNSCSIAAVVRVGESKTHKAPWIAGTILPMSVGDFQRFQACQLSGDWAPHRERRGWKEFVASLAVPVPGFARSTNVAAVRVDDNSVVVASTVPIMLSESAYSDEPEPDTGSNRMELGRIRASLGAGHRQTLAEIRNRINTGAKPLTASTATATPPKEKKVGCTPCAAKRRQNGQTSAQQPAPQQVEGFGDGDGQVAAQQSQSNAIANTRATSRG